MGLLFAQSKKVCVFEALAVFTSCLFRITRLVFLRCWLLSRVVSSG